MSARLAPLALTLALLLPGCVAAVPVAPYVAGAATVGATYLGDATGLRVLPNHLLSSEPFVLPKWGGVP